MIALPQLEGKDILDAELFDYELVVHLPLGGDSAMVTCPGVASCVFTYVSCAGHHDRFAACPSPTRES